MVLDVELFRADKDGIPDKIKENQAKRYKDVTLVDKVIEADTKWRKRKLAYSYSVARVFGPTPLSTARTWTIRRE